LFPWPGKNVCPLYSTLENGLPDAKTAFPSEWTYALKLFKNYYNQKLSLK